MDEKLDNWDDVTLEDVAPEEAAEETTEENSTEETENATETEENASEGAEEHTDRFVLKHLDETKEVSRDELITLGQKGLDYDRVRGKYDQLQAEIPLLRETKAKYEAVEKTISELEIMAKDAGFNTPIEFLDELTALKLAQSDNIDPELARARVALSRRDKVISVPDTPDPRKADLAAFIQSHPGLDAKDIPQEVWAMVSAGELLTSAYDKHERDQAQSKIRELETRLAAKEQAEKNAEKSTGSANTVGANKATEFDAMWYDGT